MENALLPFGRCDDQYSEKSVAGAAAHVPAARDGSISRRKALPAAAMARADRADARPRRRRALRGLLLVFGGLPGGLHRAAGDRGRERKALPGVFSDQFLALHLLRLLRGGLPDLRDSAHARLRDERVQTPKPGLR